MKPNYSWYCLLQFKTIYINNHNTTFRLYALPFSHSWVGGHLLNNCPLSLNIQKAIFITKLKRIFFSAESHTISKYQCHMTCYHKVFKNETKVLALIYSGSWPNPTNNVHRKGFVSFCTKDVVVLTAYVLSKCKLSINCLTNIIVLHPYLVIYLPLGSTESVWCSSTYFLLNCCI